MKDNDLNLDILENADRNTVERLSQEYRALSDSDMARLYAKSEKIYKKRQQIPEEGYSATVSGVEVYRRPMWKKITAIAASLILIPAAVGGGVLFIKNRNAIKDTGNPTGSHMSAEELIGSMEETPYKDLIINNTESFDMFYEDYISPDNPLQLSGGPYNEAYVIKPVKAMLVDGDSAVCLLNVWDFPVIDKDSNYIGFINYDMRDLIENSVPTFFGGEMIAPQLNEALKKGDIAYFATVDGEYGIYEDNTVVALAPNTPEYSGSITFEQVRTEYNILSADCREKIIYSSSGPVWDNLLDLPDHIFETPEIPEELKGKNIIDHYPMYEWGFDYKLIENDFEYSDNILFGTVDRISYPATGYGGGSSAYTQIEITVSGDINGNAASGEKATVYITGGYISMRSSYGDNLYKTGGKYGNGVNMTEEEIDNIYFREIVDSTELPIVGKEYAFLVKTSGSGNYSNVGQLYGILYNCENVYVHRNTKGMSFYTVSELRKAMTATGNTGKLPVNTPAEGKHEKLLGMLKKLEPVMVQNSIYSIAIDDENGVLVINTKDDADWFAITEYLKGACEDFDANSIIFTTDGPLSNSILYDYSARFVDTDGEYDAAEFPQVIFIRERSELDRYLADNSSRIYPEHIKELTNAFAEYDNDWFRSNQLIMVLMYEPSGSITHKITELTDSYVKIRRILPYSQTDDEAEWHVLIGVSKDCTFNDDFKVRFISHPDD